MDEHEASCNCVDCWAPPPLKSEGTLKCMADNLWREREEAAELRGYARGVREGLGKATEATERAMRWAPVDACLVEPNDSGRFIERDALLLHLAEILLRFLLPSPPGDSEGPSPVPRKGQP